MTFDEKLEELFQDLMRARDTYEAWWNLKNEEVRPKYVATMNRYSEYFIVAVHSHFVAMLMALFRLYDDTSPKALSIPRFLVSAQSEAGVPREVRERAEAGLKSVEPTIKKIRLLRDKVFAHRDRSYTYERALEEVDLIPDEIGRLTEDTLVIINSLMRARNQGAYEFEHKTKRDLLKLLSDLNSLQPKRSGLR
jgi:hypothetical protein